jgi:hypothetical protein
MDWTKPDWLKKEEKEKRKAAKIKPGLTRVQMKEAKDRAIMEAFKNFIRAGTVEYMSYVHGGRANDVMYLATHSKRACVDREIAWQCSREFLVYRFLDVDEGTIREAFYYFHDLTVEEPGWRKKHFGNTKKKP